MKAKIISIGDEILIGQIINSNASYISENLYQTGFPVQKIVTIGDNETDLIKELEDSMRHFDVTIITGGLGPTHDDITKSILIKFFSDELVKNDKVLKNIKKIFQTRKITLPGINNQQALVPKKSKIIWNNYGTAPGIWYDIRNKIIVALPGVPFEMKEMMKKQVIPMLRKKFCKSLKTIFKSRTILTTGITESELFEKLENINAITKHANLAFLPSFSGVRIRIDSKGKYPKEVENKILLTQKLIENKLSEHIYGKDEDLIEEMIGKILLKKKLTLSVAESCTGGLLGAKITDISGSSKYFCGGVCTYTNKSKIDILYVRASSIKKYGAVSKEVAIEMAKKVREKFCSDIGISITGIAGPTGGTKLKPAGTVYIGYSDKKDSFARNYLFGTYRERNRERAVMSALILLYNQLINFF